MERELMVYLSADCAVKVNVLLENGTAWFTMEQMCQSFGENEVIIGGHLTSIYAEGELREADAVRRIGESKPTNYYSLDVVLAVGFRVRSKQGQQFRIWAMQQLRESILK